MLSEEDKDSIIKEFPNIKLSYENMAHKIVYNSDSVIYAIPSGIKSFVWFTEQHDKPVCYLLELDRKRTRIQNVRTLTACYSREVCYGTILYGTYFRHMNTTCFSIEDIFYNKGACISRDNWGVKMEHITKLLGKDIKQISYNPKFTIFGLPLMSNSNEDMQNAIQYEIKYKIESIQYRLMNRSNNYLWISIDTFMKHRIESRPVKIPDRIKDYKEYKDCKENKEYKDYNATVYTVKPDILNDVYHLFSGEKYIGLACIPDFETSKMMNKIFRKIKENDDLDKLEESDDEDEFQNSNLDKFVYLERTAKMSCVFHKKFKKWVPKKIVDKSM